MIPLLLSDITAISSNCYGHLCGEEQGVQYFTKMAMEVLTLHLTKLPFYIGITGSFSLSCKKKQRTSSQLLIAA